MFRKFFSVLTASFVLLAMVQTANAAGLYEGQSFSGGWNLTYNRQGDIDIGDSSDGTFLDLRSTSRYCVHKGAGYSTMNRYIRSNYPDNVRWSVDEICNDGYVRICVSASWGAVACSTYSNHGWKD
ncbi:MAG: hypothetical protein ACI92I_000315 [Acidimicrobiales bacterium]|jgi:hypothetical protein